MGLEKVVTVMKIATEDVKATAPGGEAFTFAFLPPNTEEHGCPDFQEWDQF